MKSPVLLLASTALAFSSMVLHAQSAAPAFNPAVAFGAQPGWVSPELSPDGKHVVYIGPGSGTSNIVFVVDIASGTAKPIARADGKPLRVTHCGWSASDRLVCEQYGLVRNLDHGAQFIAYTRMLAMDIDGRNIVPLGKRDTDRQLYRRQFDGTILDWRDGSDGKLLISRYYVPEMTTGRRTAQTDEGYGVDLVDTRTETATVVETAKLNADYWSDGRGAVRLMSREGEKNGILNGKTAFYYRTLGDREWRKLGNDAEDSNFEPLAVDSGTNAAYVLKTHEGRQALFSISLDGSLKTELVFAHPQVDVRSVVTMGRAGRVIGAYYATEMPHVEYFDPAYRKLAASLARALPQLPLISFVSSDAKEQLLLILARSDTDPGHYYLFDRATNKLSELMVTRPELEHVKLAQVKPVSYPAADGTSVPAYLTLPPGVDKPEGLPAIVMPHGGPASRDVWGFDWLAQYYANRGFAVLQPNFRGSAGYGNDWFVTNGFRSWKVAIGDIIDGGRWLVSQGVADPGKLAVVGWSYGGYAALQANVVDPGLFKAVVAIAPVTDLDMVKKAAEGFTNVEVVRAYVGTGPHVEEGSPARHAEQFKAPVILFHGDNDANVDVAQSQVMDKVLKRAGKKSELIVYPHLDHSLDDNAARTDMLQRSYDFLRGALGT